MPKYQAPPRNEACVLIIDVGRSMNDSMYEGEADGVAQSGLQIAKRAVQLKVRNKLIDPKQDQMGLLLLGSDDTSNPLNDAEPGLYQNISLYKEIQKPDISMLDAIESVNNRNDCITNFIDSFIPEGSRSSGDAIDGILVAMQILKQHVEKRRVQKRIYLLTDAAGDIVNDPEAMEAIEEGIRKEDFKINIIGMGFEEDDDEDEDEGDESKVKVKKNDEDEDGDMEMEMEMDDEEKEGNQKNNGEEKKPKFRVKLERDSGDSSAAAAAAASSSAHRSKVSLRTETQRLNEKLLKRFARHIEGTVVSSSTALQMLQEFQSRTVNQVTKLRGVMTIGSLRVNVWSYGKTAVQNMKSFKKMVVGGGGDGMENDEEMLADARAGKRGEEEEEDYYGDRASSSSTGAASSSVNTVSMDRTYKNTKADDEKLIDKDDRNRAFRYGRERVPVTDEDLEQFKFHTDKGIEVLSFVSKKVVSRYRYMSTVDCIVAEPGADNVRSALLLSAFIHALHEQEKVAIVRYVKRQNANPLLGVLIPIIKPDVECFYFNQLPFVEDERDYQFDDLSHANVSDNQQAAADALVDAMDLMGEQDPDTKDFPDEILNPNNTFNPVLQRFYECIKERARGVDFQLDDDTMTSLDRLVSYTKLDPQVAERSQHAVEQFQQFFSLQVPEENDKKKRGTYKNWYGTPLVDIDVDIAAAGRRADELAAAAAAGGADLVDTSHPSRGESVFSLDSHGHVDKIGAVDPIRDFNQLLTQRGAATNARKAIQEMAQVIHRLVQQSHQGRFYQRAIDCLIAMRAGGIKVEEANDFNDLLTDLKRLYMPTPEQPHRPKSDFWTEMIKSNIMPIDDTEVSASKLTVEEARAFYSTQASQASAASATPIIAAAMEDALFEEME